MRLDRGQTGFALITVMIVVALIAIISSQLIWTQQAQIKRSSFMLHQAQGFAVSYGMEAWVKQGLELDRDNNKTDHLSEMWAQPLPPVEFAGGEISGVMVDAQSRINLNGLLNPNQKIREFWSAAINRYFEQRNQSWPLADLARDWMDADSNPQIYGAESDRYQIEQPPYTAANQMLVSIREVERFAQFNELEPEVRLAIRADFSALPAMTGVNVNTASAAVLSALTDWMNPTIAEAWLQLRIQTPAEEIQVFLDFAVQQTGLDIEKIKASLPDGVVTVNTEFFELNSLVMYGEVEQGINGLFYRPEKGNAALIQRWLTQAFTGTTTANERQSYGQ